jgi:hypothetical protein
MYKGPADGWTIVNNSWDCLIEDQDNLVYFNRCWLSDSDVTGGAWSFDDDFSVKHIGHTMAAWFWATGSGSNTAKSDVEHNWSSMTITGVEIGGWPPNTMNDVQLVVDLPEDTAHQGHW